MKNNYLDSKKLKDIGGNFDIITKHANEYSQLYDKIFNENLKTELQEFSWLLISELN
jgi:hypothetical protein